MRFKRLSIIITILLIVTMITACGSKDNAKEVGSDGQVTLNFGLWDKFQEPVLKEIAKNFEAENPNIKIEFQLTPFGQYWTKLEAAATGEVLPDIF